MSAPPASSIFSTIQLSNGLQMPIFGLGTSHHGGYSHDAVVYALTECGVRHIDTAERYGCEEQLGKAIIDSMVPRGDLWITNKLWPGNYGYQTAKEACVRSCKRMGLEYFDLYLMHWPGAFESCDSNRETRAETWRVLEELYEEGICKSIGVSNFLVHHLEQLKEDSGVVPHVNQVEYHPYQQPTTILEYCKQEGIVFEGYCPLAKGQLLNDPTVLQIAEKHSRTPAQICIRWSLQKGVVTIPKSTKKERIRENCQVFDFHLDKTDMDTLGKMHDGRHMSWDPSNMYKIKHLGLQTVSTNICERMGHSQELSEFQRGTMIGCHLCNKSSCEISSKVNCLVYNKVEAIGNDSNSATKR